MYRVTREVNLLLHTTQQTIGYLNQDFVECH
jgi:hypothetical protein